MLRNLLFLAFTLAFVRPVVALPDDGPPISITSPDKATTFAYGMIKTHSLFWNKSKKLLVASVTFTDPNSTSNAGDDTHEFSLPGVTFDEAKGIFYATDAKGDSIPVAHIKKMLFMKTVETTPNAAVRVIHPKGNITVVLEAISPDDPAMHPPADNSDPDGTHKVDINSILN